VAVKLRNANSGAYSGSRRLPHPTAEADTITDAALRCLQQFDLTRRFRSSAYGLPI